MALEMKTKCEKCGKPLPLNSDEANICSYECTFCNECAKASKYTCPNCKGELIERARRNKNDGSCNTSTLNTYSTKR